MATLSTLHCIFHSQQAHLTLLIVQYLVHKFVFIATKIGFNFFMVALIVICNDTTVLCFFLVFTQASYKNIIEGPSKAPSCVKL